jgi:hypothetical protein
MASEGTHRVGHRETHPTTRRRGVEGHPVPCATVCANAGAPTCPDGAATPTYANPAASDRAPRDLAGIARHPHGNETRVTGHPRSPEVFPSVWDRTIASMRTRRRVPRRSLFPRRGLLLRSTPAARWPAHRSPQGRHRQLSTLSQPSPVPSSIEPTLLLRPADSQSSESEVVAGVPESDTNPLGTDVRNGAPRRTHRETHPRRRDKGGESVRVRQSLRNTRTGSVIDESADLDTLNRPESL